MNSAFPFSSQKTEAINAESLFKSDVQSLNDLKIQINQEYFPNQEYLRNWLQEDLGTQYASQMSTLPTKLVRCHLNIKSSLVLSGLPYFLAVFKYLGHQWEPSFLRSIEAYEGKKFSLLEENLQNDKNQGNTIFSFDIPFSIAILGERLALNLLQRSSAISTMVEPMAMMAEAFGIKILDTRKTTPGLRELEKYAIFIGGGRNHRNSQSDVFMIKDNHKHFFGSLTEAVHYFRSLNSFYTPIIAEIHNLKEFNEAVDCGLKHVLLDNFTPGEIQSLCLIKPKSMTFEVSGSIQAQNLSQYLIKGVDAISIGSMTFYPQKVDISLKMSSL